MDENFKNEFLQYVSERSRELTDEEREFNYSRIEKVRDDRIEMSPDIFVEMARMGALQIVEDWHGNVVEGQEMIFDDSEDEYYENTIYADKNELGTKALIAAYKEGHEKIVGFLLENSKINLEDVLVESSQLGHFEMTKFLVESGVDIHAENDGALRWASMDGHYQVCQYLVEQGADPQKVVDDEDISEANKQWAIDFVNARNLANKLTSELDKPSKADRLVASIDHDAEAPTKQAKSTRQKI